MSGVEQMKIPGNTAKSAEERNIPWSQQVDEASYENLASPTTDESSVANQSSMQFQYPPFYAKENQNSVSNNYKPRKQSNNYDSNKKYGKSGIYNNSKREDYQQNAWNTRRLMPENSAGNFNRPIKNDESYISNKLDNRQTKGLEDYKSSSTSATASAVPKKTTWASIASQPAKLTLRTTLTTSSQKKKGPGMPPPPMVPGKHNLDVNTWDLPNNNPPPMPSPPPPIDLSCSDIHSDFSLSSASEPPLGARPDKSHNKPAVEFPQKDETNNKNAFNISNNFQRVRDSPNGHARKSWSTQHPLHMQRPSVGVACPPSSVIRRAEASGNSANRYGERKGTYTNARNDYEGNPKPYEIRDENNSRNSEPPVQNVVADLPGSAGDPQALLEDLRLKNNYNPAEIDLEMATSARFFVIKSYSEDDIHRSIKYEIWCSTDHGNKRLDDAFKERHKEGGNILLFFSVNGSGHFCGMAQMMTSVDYNSTSSVWAEDKWKGKFKVKWIYVKDVPNSKLRHIRLENNDNKSVTHSRDTQEVPNSKGIEVLQILHSFKHSTSIFDDFSHYEKKQEEEVSSKRPPISVHEGMGPFQQTQSPINRHFNRRNEDRERDGDSRDIRGTNSGTAQKFFSGGSGGFRSDRNAVYRSGGFHNNYSEHRRGFESQRTIASEYHHKDKDSTEPDRENDFGGRHIPKFEFIRRDENLQSKPRNINRDRDFSAELNKSDTRFRSGLTLQRESIKDNEKDRVRSTEY